MVRGGVEAALKTRLKLLEIRIETPARIGAVRRFGADLDRGRADQSLDFAHGVQQTVALGGVERRQHGRREIVREPVIGRPFRASLARQAHTAASTVPSAFRHRDQSLCRQGLEQAAEITGIESELAAKRAEIDAVGPDLEQKPRLRQRPAPAQVVDLERADALGHGAVEAADLQQLVLVHSLTLVRYLSAFKPAGGEARPQDHRRAPGQKESRAGP